MRTLFSFWFLVIPNEKCVRSAVSSTGAERIYASAFIFDTNQQPLYPVRISRATLLLS
ncbi:MAG: hypothetical protein V7L29_14455 [Nostoc sp.]|uniref:hypothetical protein n=1 Tax=Nostoc sp. TaxID=1180 RepID=UPI002FF35F8F